MRDFAKIIRTSDGAQVLLYIEWIAEDDDGRTDYCVLHQICNRTEAMYDLSIKKDDESGFLALLEKADTRYADILAQALTEFCGVEKCE